MNSKKIGLPPGTLHYSGPKRTEKIKITAYNYNQEHAAESITTQKQIADYKTKSSINWINIDGLHNVSVIESIGKTFNVDSLVLEDILNTQHRPKAEQNEETLFVTLKMLGIHPKKKTIVSEQVSFILGAGFLLSFQEREGDIFDSIREKINTENSLIRKNGVDFLLYRLIDNIVDNYFHVVELITDKTEKLEQKILTDFDKTDINQIQSLKKQLISLRKSVSPLREAISSIQKNENKLIKKETQKYLRDLYEHVIQVADFVDSQKDMIGSVQDLYHSEVGNKMNQIMQVLTIISTIFIPITFIAGIYGMNFKHMPELQSKYGYFIVWGVMLLCVAVMLVYFRRKKWL